MSDKIDVNKIKIRKSWGKINPATKIEKVKTDYNRAAFKRAAQEELENELLEDSESAGC